MWSNVFPGIRGRSRAAVTAAGRRGFVTRAAPGIAVVVFCVVLLDRLEVPPSQSLRYAGYETGYVVLPGIAALLALLGARELGLFEVAVGIALGYAIEVALYVITAATDTRGLFPFYPLVVLAVALPFVRYRPRRPQASFSPAAAWWLATEIAVIVGFLAASILNRPLPQNAPSLTQYPDDMLWSSSVTAEAVHHWPLDVPGFAGFTLHYHYFAYLEMAATSRVTGLDPWLLNFRLLPVWAAAILAVQLYLAGRLIGGRRLVGLLSVAFFLIVQVVTPWGEVTKGVFGDLYNSATFAFGLLVMVPLVVVVYRCLQPPAGDVRRGGPWIVLATLALLSVGAKAPVPIVVLGGVAFAALVVFVRDRRLPLRFAGVGAIVAAAFGIGWLLLFRASATGIDNVLWAPLWPVKERNPFFAISLRLPGPLDWLLWAIAAVLLAVKLFILEIPGMAAAWVWARGRLGVVLLTGFGLAGLLVYDFFQSPGISQAYFLWFGYVGVAICAAIGSAMLIDRFVRPISLRPGVVVAAVVLLLAVWSISPGNAPDDVWSVMVQSHGAPNAEFVGLRWIAQHTDPNAVLAVDPRGVSTSCFQSTFAERRAMLGCAYGYTPAIPIESASRIQAAVSRQLYAQIVERKRLNDAIFDRADRAAIAEAARRFGVRYVVVDLASGGKLRQIRMLRARIPIVYRNRSIAVLRVPA